MWEMMTPPPVKEKCRMHGEDEDNPNLLSFKDMLMEDQKDLEEELTGREEDLDFDQEDIVIENEGQLPSNLLFAKDSCSVNQAWPNMVVVKLLDRSIGYRALCSRLEIRPFGPCHRASRSLIRKTIFT